MGPDISLIAIFVGVPYVLVSAYKARLSHDRFMKVLQLKSELNARLLDRVGSDPEVVNLLKSEAQHQLFDVKLSEPDMAMPHSRMLTSLQIACMLISVGVGAVVLRSFMLETYAQERAAYLGTFAISLGFGALLSAAAASAVGKMIQRERQAS